MATITRYVNMASSAGGDGTTNATSGDNRAYASLQEWETAEACDLTDGGGDIMDCICEGATNDTNCNILGWTTSSTCYMQIRTTQANRHSGKLDEAKYQLEGSSGNPTLFMQEENVRFIGIQSNTQAVGDVLFYLNASGQLDIRITHCIMKEVASTTEYILYLPVGAAGSVIRVHNNLFYDGYCAAYLGNATTTYRFYNNTIKDMSAWGVRYASGADYLKNNIIDCTDALYGTFTNDDAQNDYNKTSQNADDNALGSHGAYNVTFAYADSGADDFHLDSGDVVCKDLGVDLTSEGGFTDDIDGDERGVLWSIGMDEPPTSGQNVPEKMNHYRRLRAS